MNATAPAPQHLSSDDVRLYSERIGLAITPGLNVETLHALARAHVQAIPFENLDVLLGRPIELAPEALLQKLVRERRGGYCFESNGLLLHVLEALGFEASPLAARVRIQRPRDMTPPRTHMFVRVDLRGQTWLLDVGVGAMSVTSALKMAPGVVQETPHERRRIVQEDGRYFHQVELGGAWQDVSEFSLEPMPLIDRQIANWYTSTHPNSHFRQNLMVAKAEPDGGRTTLMNRELTIRPRQGEAQKRLLNAPGELLQALREEFGIALPGGTELPLPA